MNNIINKLFHIPRKEGNVQQLKDNGICGLQNMGNTCYINSVIQCIRHDAYLFEYYKEDFHKRHLNKNSEIDGFYKCLETVITRFLEQSETNYPTSWFLWYVSENGSI